MLEFPNQQTMGDVSTLHQGIRNAHRDTEAEAQAVHKSNLKDKERNGKGISLISLSVVNPKIFSTEQFGCKFQRKGL